MHQSPPNLAHGQRTGIVEQSTTGGGAGAFVSASKDSAIVSKVNADRANKALRTCSVTGQALTRHEMIRFVLSPDGDVIADLAERLPGRGVWISAQRSVLLEARKRSAFQRGFKTGNIHFAQAPDDWLDQIASVQRDRCLSLIGLARRAGHLVTGFETVRKSLRTPMPGSAPAVRALVIAQDAARDSTTKATQLARHVNAQTVLCFDQASLSASTGIENARFLLMTSPSPKGSRAGTHNGESPAARLLREVTKYQNLLAIDPIEQNKAGAPSSSEPTC